MSEFTTMSSTGSGIFRSEIPQQFFTEMKQYILSVLESIPEEKNWDACLKYIASWSDDDILNQVQELQRINPGIDENFRYTVLRATKSMYGGNDRSITVRSKFLSNINFTTFVQQFTQAFATSRHVNSRARFFELRPTDIDVIAMAAFRHALYSQVRTKQAFVVKQHDDIQPDDSVSCAPSEVISVQDEPSSLSKDLLKLHQAPVDIDLLSKVTSQKEQLIEHDKISPLKSRASRVPPAEEIRSKVSRISRIPSEARSRASRVPPAEEIRSKVSRASRVSTQSRRANKLTALKSQVSLRSNLPSFSKHNKSLGMSHATEEIELDITSSTSKRNSKYAREIKPQLKVKPEPSFFEDDGLEEGTVYSRC